MSSNYFTYAWLAYSQIVSNHLLRKSKSIQAHNFIHDALWMLVMRYSAHHFLNGLFVVGNTQAPLIPNERFGNFLSDLGSNLGRQIFAMFASFIRLCSRRPLTSRSQVVSPLPIKSTEPCDPFPFNIRVATERENFYFEIPPAIFTDCITEIGFNSSSRIRSVLRQACRKGHLSLPDVLLLVLHVCQQIDHPYSILRGEIAQ